MRKPSQGTGDSSEVFSQEAKTTSSSGAESCNSRWLNITGAVKLGLVPVCDCRGREG